MHACKLCQAEALAMQGSSLAGFRWEKGEGNKKNISGIKAEAITNRVNGDRLPFN